MRSMLQLIASHDQKIYFSGPLIRRVERQPNGQKPADNKGWRDSRGQLEGTTLALWDVKEIEEAREQGRQAYPQYINIADAFVHLMGTHTTPETPEGPSKTFANVFSVNTAGANLLLFSCPSTQALESWIAALRLAAWDKSRLEEMYTAHLIKITLNDGRDIRSPLVHGRMEGCVRIRVAGQTDWKMLWMAVTACGAWDVHYDAGYSDGRPTSPNTSKNNRPSHEGSPPRMPSKPFIQIFASQRPEDRNKVLLTLKDVTQSFTKPLISSKGVQSASLKLEGVFGNEEMAGSMMNSEAWLQVLPMAEPGVDPNKVSWLLQWLVAIHDAFELYGRPRTYNWDPRDPESSLFGYPTGPNQELLCLDREIAEILDPRNHRISSVRRQLRQILWQRMNGLFACYFTW
ncbi:hypothetical protein EUX98_g4163 [Antrodiella citrinella]|uniref:PH domain-containing protein n=1 Tax=Antrodiella citrinella TaxID=2447956 RepID=A0A4V3XIP5_9APHY|nr:hypothetical protein EUX98_g4163 [Antrodiella citrinella]